MAQRTRSTKERKKEETHIDDEMKRMNRQKEKEGLKMEYVFLKFLFCICSNNRKDSSVSSVMKM